MKVIGKINFTRTPGPEQDTRWSRILPRYQAVDGSWVRLSDEERKDSFPSQGLIFWYDSPRLAEKEGSWWELNVALDEQHGGTDNYEVVSPSTLYQLESISLGEVELRRRVANGDITLSRAPVGPVLLDLPNSPGWIGPIEFDDGKTEGPSEIPTGFLTVYDLPEKDIQQLSLDDRSITTIAPHIELQAHENGLWAAQDDKHLLLGLFKRLQHVGSDLAEASSITQRTFSEYQDTLAQLGLSGADAQRERARVQAANSLLQEIDLNRELLDAAVESLFENPRVQEELEERVDAAVTERLEELEKTFEEKRSEKQERLNELNERLSETKAEVERREAAIEKMRDEAEAELESLASSIMSSPIELLANHFVHSALDKQSTPHQRSAPTSLSYDPHGEELTSLAGLRGALQTAAAHFGLRPYDCYAGLAGLLSGRPLLLTDDTDLDLCRAFYSVISSGCGYIATVPNDIFSIDDLLSLPTIPFDDDSPSGEVGEVLQQLSDIDVQGTLLFRGVNRAPLESAFSVLLPNSSVSAQPAIPWKRNQRAHDSVVPVPQTANVNIIATLIEGPSTFTVPRQVLQRAAVIRTDAERRSPADPTQPLPECHVKAEMWSSISDDIAHDSESAPDLPTLTANSALDDDYSYYSSIFNEGVDAATAWITTRVAASIGLSQLRSRLSEMPEPVRNEVEALLSSQQLEHIREITDEV